MKDFDMQIDTELETGVRELGLVALSKCQDRRLKSLDTKLHGLVKAQFELRSWPGRL